MCVIHTVYAAHIYCRKRVVNNGKNENCRTSAECSNSESLLEEVLSVKQNDYNDGSLFFTTFNFT